MPTVLRSPSFHEAAHDVDADGPAVSHVAEDDSARLHDAGAATVVVVIVAVSDPPINLSTISTNINHSVLTTSVVVLAT